MENQEESHNSELKIGIIIIARDEEQSIELILNALMNQSIKPYEIVVVNDNSIDNTRQIALRYNIKVIDFPYEHENWVISGKLAKVFNLGFERISKNLDYYLILGGDTVLSKNYIELVIKKMRKNQCDIGSGVIENEEADLRGSGRIISSKLMKSQNFSYAENYGFETYMIFRARCDGFCSCVENKAKSNVTRKTGTFYNPVKIHNRGSAYRALGYSFLFTLIVGLRLYFKKPSFVLSFLNGWFSCPKSSFYEKEIREFTKKYQKERIKKFILKK